MIVYAKNRRGCKFNEIYNNKNWIRIHIVELFQSAIWVGIRIKYGKYEKFKIKKYI